MFDPRFALLGDSGPTQDQVSTFRNYARLARTQAAGGDPYGAQQSYWTADALFQAMGSPTAYKDELDYAAAAVFGGSGTEGAGAVGAVADVQAGQKLYAAGLVNSRPQSVSGSFFSSISSSLDDALASIGSVPSYVKLGLLGLALAKIFKVL